VLNEVFAGAGFRIMRGIRRLSPRRFLYLRHLSAFRIDGDGNSLPVAEKSTGTKGNRATQLINILFWDNPMFGSVSRADGYSRAQTRQIGSFLSEGGERRVDVVEFIEICKAIEADPNKLLKMLIQRAA
jgi:hypothetical protein